MICPLGQAIDAAQVHLQRHSYGSLGYPETSKFMPSPNEKSGIFKRSIFAVGAQETNGFARYS